VTIRFDGDLVDTSPERVSTGLSGAFSATFAVPSSSEAGENEVRATDSAGNRATAIFQLIVDEDESSSGGGGTSDPAARPQTVRIAEDTAVLIRLRTSAQGDDIRFDIVNQPSHGLLTDFDSELGTVVYTPHENYFGRDSFTFRVKGSNTVATVSITISEVNDPPTAQSQSLQAIEDASLQIVLSGSDVESGNDITFEISNEPGHGKLTGIAPNLKYTPDKDYSGFDGFSFRTFDGQAKSELTTVRLVVAAVNDPPIVDKLTNIFIQEGDRDMRIVLVATDIDSQSVSFSIPSGPKHGTLTRPMTTGPMVAILTYAPNQGYAGKDEFTFMVDDGSTDNGVSSPGKVSITVGNLGTGMIGAADSLTGLQLPDQSLSEGTEVSTGTTTQTGEDPGVSPSQDLAPPRLNIPVSPIEIQATSEEGAVVIYATSASDEVDGVLPPLCNPASGSVFPVGLITVRCSATDSSGNGVEKEFTVSVLPFEGASYQEIIGSPVMISAVLGFLGAALATILLVRRKRLHDATEQAKESTLNDANPS
jgi:hypothetical protein